MSDSDLSMLQDEQKSLSYNGTLTFHFALNLNNYKEMNCLVDKKSSLQLQRQFWQSVSLVTASGEISLQMFFGKRTMSLSILWN